MEEKPRRKKKPEVKKAKETKEKIKALRVKAEKRKEALTEIAVSSEQPQDKSVSHLINHYESNSYNIYIIYKFHFFIGASST